MATVYTNPTFNDGPWQRAYFDFIVTPPEASRIYVINDTVRGHHLGIATKIAAGWIDLEPLDVNATPTATAQVHVTNGTTTKKIISLTAAQVKAGGIYYMNESEGAGFVCPASGYYLEFKILAAVATGQAGIVQFGIGVTGLCYKGEDPTAPTG